MKKFALSFVIGIGLFILFGSAFHVNASAATVYVAGDSTGNDSRTKEQAQSSSTPWHTIQKAVDESEAGDTINVKGGITYSDARECVNGYTSVVCVGYPSPSGTAEAPITFQAWPGTGIPIIDASNAHMGLIITGSYFKINGFKVGNSPAGTEAKPMTAAVLAADSTGLIISNNIIYNNVLAGIFSFGLINSTIVNNTITTTPYGILLGTQGTILENNILTECGTAITYQNEAEPSIAPSDTQEESVVMDYNLFYNNETNYSGITQGSHDVFADPKFVNQTTLNFNLQPGSPAINNGTTIEAVTQDIIQIPRPQSSQYDIGAYEYYSPSIALTPLTPNPTTTNRPTFSGSATTVSGANIKRIYYSIDGGSWSTSGVKPSDGSFNSRHEHFTISLISSLSYEDHTIRVKAEDTNGSVSGISQESFIVAGYSASSTVTTTTATTTEATTEEPTEEAVDEEPTNSTTQPQNNNSKDSTDKKDHTNTQLVCLILILCLAPFVIGFSIYAILNTKKKS